MLRNVTQAKIKCYLKNRKKRDNLRDLGAHGRTVLKSLKETVGECGMNSHGSELGTIARICEHSNEPLYCIFKASRRLVCNTTAVNNRKVM
jgi:hypothetical protein